MRWKRKAPEPLIGSRRTITIFAFYPILLEGEYRWMEYVSINQMREIGSWTNVSWADW